MQVKEKEIENLGKEFQNSDLLKTYAEGDLFGDGCFNG